MSTYVETIIRKESEENKKTPCYDIIKNVFSNHFCQAITFFIIFSAVIPTAFYYWMNDLQDLKENGGFYCALKNEYKVKCGVNNVSYEKCLNINCCYDDLELDCYHSVPSKYGYSALSNDTNTFTTRQTITPYGRPIEQNIKLSIVEANEHTVKVILHKTNVIIEETKLDEKAYLVTKNIEKLGADIYRKTGERILTTSRGPLIVSETYWEWTIQLTDDELFGLGDLLLNSTEPITKVIYKNQDDHTTIASFLAHQKGRYHGLVIEHEGPLEVTVLPSKLIVLKYLAGDYIRLNLFTGPTPHDVFLQARNYQSKILPRWIFGTHLCRNNKVSSLNEIINGFKLLPNYGSDCIHENLMMFYLIEKDQMIIDKLDEIIKNLKDKTMFQFPLLPMLPVGDYSIYQKAESMEVLYKDEKNQVWKGVYSELPVSFLDFTSENIQIFMDELINKFEILGASSFVLLNNWPQEDSFIVKNNEKYFQYINEAVNKSLSHTIPWNLKDSKSTLHLVTHNDYTKIQTTVLKTATKQNIIVSSYQYGMEEPAIIQNAPLTWNGFKNTLASLLYHSSLINPYITSSICGSKSILNYTNEDICTRWHLTAMTLPIFVTSHAWPKDYTKFNLDVVKKAANVRETLISYYHNYLVKGEPLIRPMFYDYFNDQKTLGIRNQYMLGDSLLVYQPILPKLSTVEVYFPKVRNGWYEYWGGDNYNKVGLNKFYMVESDWIMFIKAGSVLPLRDVENNENINILIAMDCLNNECNADGELLFENSVIKFTIINSNTMKVTNLNEAKKDIGCNSKNMKYPFIIQRITVYAITHIKKIKIEVSVDLCKVTDDFVDIQLWK